MEDIINIEIKGVKVSIDLTESINNINDKERIEYYQRMFNVGLNIDKSDANIAKAHDEQDVAQAELTAIKHQYFMQMYCKMIEYLYPRGVQPNMEDVNDFLIKSNIPYEVVYLNAGIFDFKAI